VYFEYLGVSMRGKSFKEFLLFITKICVEGEIGKTRK
jgi:hypothetical protein